MADVKALHNDNNTINLPPGFRFHPRDKEIIAHYLLPKVMSSNFSSTTIGDVDLNKTEPWDLPSKAKMGEEEWYFFSRRDRKYPTGMRTNRATEAGYWKATGKDKEIFGGKGVLIGMKKTLVFYNGRAPKGEKTNWVMHEFRLNDKSYTNLPKTAKDEWVVCKVFNKSLEVEKSPVLMSGLTSMNSFGENLVDPYTLPSLMEPPFFNTNYTQHYADVAGNFNIFSGMENELDSNKSFFLGINSQLPISAYYSQIQPQTTHFSTDGVTTMGHLHQDQPNEYCSTVAINKHCTKGKQSSSQTRMSVSQDTRLSTERNIDVSSMNMGISCNDTDEESIGQAIDLDNLWRF